MRWKVPVWTGWILVGLLLVALLVSVVVWYKGSNAYVAGDPYRIEQKQAPQDGQLVAYPGRNIDYGSKFRDLNSMHMETAKVVGLSAPLEDKKAVKKCRGKLVRISSTKNYMVDELEHSLPYLTPAASLELERIAADFADILDRNNLPHYRFIVTSVLRTEESVKQLRKSGNVNATTNSAHCYGTTFDITYKRFDKNDRSADYMSDENLKLVLGQALLNEQRAGRIYVKYEVKQACFHITSRQ